MSQPKATDIDPEMKEPEQDQLGNQQPFPIMGLDPFQPFPGRVELHRRRRQLIRHIHVDLRSHPLIPLTAERINRANNALINDYETLARRAQRNRQRLFWDLNAPEPYTFAGLFGPYIARFEGINNLLVARISLSNSDRGLTANIECEDLINQRRTYQLRK